MTQSTKQKISEGRPLHVRSIYKGTQWIFIPDPPLPQVPIRHKFHLEKFNFINKPSMYTKELGLPDDATRNVDEDLANLISTLEIGGRSLEFEQIKHSIHRFVRDAYDINQVPPHVLIALEAFEASLDEATICLGVLIRDLYKDAATKMKKREEQFLNQES